MVRVLCHNPVGGCCRSQPEDLTPVEYTEGKNVIDAAMANRAAGALNAHNEDSNFSTDSNFPGTSSESGSSSDSDYLCITEADPNVDQKEVLDMKRQRRRERNKVSAQNYRQRRRAQTTSQNQILVDLEKRHQELLEMVRNLEEQKSIIEGLIKKKAKIPWPWGCHPTTHPYSPVTEGMCGSATSMDAPMSMTSAIVAS